MTTKLFTIVEPTTQSDTINQRFQKCYQTECVAERNNEVNNRVNYPPVAIDDEVQNGINSETERDIKN